MYNVNEKQLFEHSQTTIVFNICKLNPPPLIWGSVSLYFRSL